MKLMHRISTRSKQLLRSAAQASRSFMMLAALPILLSMSVTGVSAQTDSQRSAPPAGSDTTKIRAGNPGATKRTHPDLAKVTQALVIKVEDEVDLGMVSYIERAVKEAEQLEQSGKRTAIVLHINTFGGRVDAATKIRDAVLGAKVSGTVAFIDKRAISAGALIALSAQEIVMSSGATMGAATPVYGDGEKGSEKVVSYMRGEMRSTAESHGRNPLVAEAMVDETLGLDSVAGLALEKGKLLTLTTEDAKKVGYLDTTAESLSEALRAVGIPSAQIANADENFGDKLVRFLTNGLVSSLLIMIGLGGIFYTIKTGHFGSITIAAVIALLLFFGGQYITEIAPTIAGLIFLVGIGLLIAEIFIPSFGLLGVAGFGCVFLGLFMALAGDFNTLTPGRISETFSTLAVSIVGLIAIAPWFKKITNQVASGDMTEIVASIRQLLGKEGTAITQLRPGGLAMIDGRKVDVVTTGEFLDRGAEVIVVDVSSNRVMVKGSPSTAAQTREPHEDDSFGGRLPGNLEARV
jgi:membrane-bound serine protease (ClpP class)